MSTGSNTCSAPPPRRRRRLSYPTSSEYWQDHRPMLVSIGVQTNPDPVRPSTPPPSYSQALFDRRTVNHNADATPLIPAPQSIPLTVPQLPPVQLSDEQRRVLDMVLSGHNVFFTGPAGTGKSLLLREIISHLRSRIPSELVAVTATTGVAGTNIGGSTVHSFAGIGLGKSKAQYLADSIAGSRTLCERWTKVRVLIIDEISMMDGVLFDKLEYVARKVRRKTDPFGGIQLVLSGDFFQLPPVPEQSHLYRRPSTYAFQANSWSACIHRPTFLTQVFRQRNNIFVDILSSMRTGDLSPTQIALLRGLSRPLRYSDGIEPSELFPLRHEVEKCNNARLSALPGLEIIYEAMDKAGYDNRGRPIPEDAAAHLLERLLAPVKVVLKLNAQVMLIKNVIQKVLVNGSTGTVIDFLTVHDAVERGYRIAEMPDKVEEEERQQKKWPNHKLVPMGSNIFSRNQKWPLVRFTDSNELLCAPLEFSIEGFMGNREATRLQVPLILAWALSVHKSQGLTLPRVKVNLGRVFEKGQAYVAISRAITMDQLEIINFQPSRVMAHETVIQWQRQWFAHMAHEASFCEEMDSEEAISQYWNDVSRS